LIGKAWLIQPYGSWIAVLHDSIGVPARAMNNRRKQKIGAAVAAATKARSGEKRWEGIRQPPAAISRR
jgi:hypothetical protein